MLKRQEGYILEHIDEKAYLLPYGQKIADLKKGVLLNETGEFLWNALASPQNLDMLCELFAVNYQIPKEERDTLQQDILSFVTELLNIGILREELHSSCSTDGKNMRIANQRVRFSGPEEAFCEEFLPFCVTENWNEDSIDFKVEIVIGLPSNHPTGTLLLRNKELVVLSWDEGYVLLFPTLSGITEAHLTKDGSYARIYCTHTFDEETRKQLFLAIRPCFLHYAQQHGYFAIHSASILYNEQAWLFSGRSGMGKSTHTALWHDLFAVPYLNGDLNLVGIQDAAPIVYGIPWCGTSEIYTTHNHPLGGIVMLDRSENDFLKELAHHEKVLQVMQRMISPTWTAPLLKRNLDFAAALVEQVPVYHLFCTKNPSAAQVIKNAIDQSK